jgi:hypothetical protein
MITPDPKCRGCIPDPVAWRRWPFATTLTGSKFRRELREHEPIVAIGTDPAARTEDDA